MMFRLAGVLYLGTLGMVTYAWWPNIHKLGVVDGNDIYGGWDALWQMLPLLALVTFTVGLAFTAAIMIFADWANRVDQEKVDTKHRARERAIEEYGEKIVHKAREQVAEAEHQLARYKRAAEEAKAEQNAAKAKAKKTREESEQAHRNVREQLKRLKQQNAKLNGH